MLCCQVNTLIKIRIIKKNSVSLGRKLDNLKKITVKNLIKTIFYTIFVTPWVLSTFIFIIPVSPIAFILNLKIDMDKSDAYDKNCRKHAKHSEYLIRKSEIERTEEFLSKLFIIGSIIFMPFFYWFLYTH